MSEPLHVQTGGAAGSQHDTPQAMEMPSKSTMTAAEAMSLHSVETFRLCGGRRSCIVLLIVGQSVP